MAQYIDKAALVAEIEKRIKETESMQPKFDQFWAGQISAFKGILKILDTLEAKDANEALRMEYEKGRVDVIAKTIEWINVFNDNNYIMQYSDSCEHPINEIIEWYKNYINRE